MAKRKFKHLLDGKDKEIELLYSSPLTIEQIAHKLGVSSTTLYEKLAELKLKHRVPRFKVKKLTTSGKTIIKIFKIPVYRRKK